METKSLYIKFIAILFLSNAVVYIITQPEIKTQNLKNQDLPRRNYTTLIIKAKLKTPITNTPYQLIDSENQKSYKPIFVLQEKQMHQNIDFQKSFPENENEYIVDIPNSLVNEVTQARALEIYPIGINIKLKKRRKYEFKY